MAVRSKHPASWIPMVAVGIATVLAAAACSSSSKGSSASSSSSGPSVSNSLGGTPVKGGTLSVALDSESCSFVPSLCTVSFAGAAVQRAVLDWLVVPSTSAQGWDTSLAQSLTPNADYTTWTATLRSGIKYSDGSPFSAQDVATDFTSYVLAPTSAMKGNFAALKSVTAPDASTVVFTLKATDSQFPNVLTLAPLFKPGPKAKTDTPIGTGPFMIANWAPNVSVTLDRNTNYWRTDTGGATLPYLDHLVFKPVTSSDTRLASLQSGQVQLALIDDPITLSQAKKIGGVQTLSAESDSGSGWFFDTIKAPTDDLRIRQALAYATDKSALVAAVGGGTVRNQYFASGSPYYSQAAADAAPTFDQAKAKQLLSAYVNDPKRSDGKAVGSPVSISLIYVNGQVAQQSYAQVAQQQWNAIGVQTTVKPEDQATVITDVIKGNYQATYFEWATPDPYGLFSHNYSLFPADPSNFTKFNSQQIQTDIAAMASAKSPADLKAATADASMVIAQNVPIVPFASTLVSWAVQPSKVANAHVSHGVQLVDFAVLSGK